MIGVDAAHWWGPLGWSYRNLTGNLTASAVSFSAGFMLARRHFLRHIGRVVDRLDHVIFHVPDIPPLPEEKK